METNRTRTVVQGALLLTVAGLISKVLSATYRIPLQNLTGDLGFYIYQQIYPLLGTVMILSLYGFPVAISKLTAEMKQNNNVITFRQFYFPLFIILLAINSIIFILIIITAPFLASSIGDENLTSAFQLGASLFLFIPFLALLRGVFQGNEQMRQTAYSQVIEQIVRVSIIIGTAYFIYIEKLNIYSIGHASVFATMCGMGITIVVLFLFFKREKTAVKSKEEIPWKYYFYTCVSLGMIAALNQLILILLQVVDVFTLVPNLIDYGLTPLEAMKTKGVFDRGQPLIQFGVVFGSSFALALIPVVVRENLQSKNDHIAYVREAILFGFYLAAGATVGLILILRETNILLFTNTAGTGSIQILVLAILLSSVTITASAVLQSLGFMKQTAIWIGLAIVVKWMLNELLVPIWGIYGSALATVGSLSFLCIAIVILLHKKVPSIHLFHHIHWTGFSFAAIGMGSCILIVKYIVNVFVHVSRFGLLFFIVFIVLTGAFIYVSLLLRYDVFTKKQLSALPFSNVILRLQQIVVKEKS